MASALRNYTCRVVAGLLPGVWELRSLAAKEGWTRSGDLGQCVAVEHGAGVVSGSV